MIRYIEQEVLIAVGDVTIINMASLCLVIAFELLVFASLHCNSQTTTLTPDVAKVVEGGDVSLVCTVRTEVLYIFWQTNKVPGAPVMGYVNDTCVVHGFLTQDIYSYTCNSTMFHLTIHDVNRSSHGDIWQCRAQGQSFGSSASIYVGVPITSVTMTPNDDSIIDVLEHSAQQFSCQTSGGRPAATVSWYITDGRKSTQLTQNVTVSNISDSENLCVTTSRMHYVAFRKQNGGSLFCQAANTANDNPVESAKIQLNVLYLPEVGKLENTTITVGSILNKSCPYTPGNPHETTFHWSRNTDDMTWNHQLLTIKSVTRNDDANYTCKVNNTISVPGQSVVNAEVRSTGTFHLTVEYETVITSFYILGFKEETILTVNEDTTVIMNCSTDSKPESTIMVSRDGRVLQSTLASKVLYYSVVQASCHDTGIYTCSGRNSHSTELGALKHLGLVINCSPRPADFVTQDITSERNAKVVLSFIARAHPLITKHGWEKLNGNNWEYINNNTDYVISTSGMAFNLTIRSVQETDFTKYRLTVSNTMGSYQHIFNMLPHTFSEEVLTIGQIIGGVIGGIACVGIIIIAVFCLCRRHRNTKSKKDGNIELQDKKGTESEVNDDGSAYYNISEKASPETRPQQDDTEDVEHTNEPAQYECLGEGSGASEYTSLSQPELGADEGKKYENL